MAASFDKDKYDMKDLDKFIKALKVKNPPKAQIGVLGQKTSRQNKKGGQTNAEVGAAHEFGSPARNLPPRSFLRMPIQDHLPEKLGQAGQYTKEMQDQVIKTGTLTPWLKKTAQLALATCREAFTNGGFGKWRQLSPGYQNKTGNILVDTTQLRDSLDERIVDSGNH